MRSRSEAGDLSSLEARLLTRFSQLDPDEVRRCVGDSAAEFEAARVRTYLAVLIERAAIDRLRALEHADSEAPNRTQLSGSRPQHASTGGADAATPRPPRRGRLVVSAPAVAASGTS
jgi:hypothetical protein